jgi:hypothetical protein
MSLFHRLNIENTNKKYIEELFALHDRDGSQKLDRAEFVAMMRDVTRRADVVSIVKASMGATGDAREIDDSFKITQEALIAFYANVQVREGGGVLNEGGFI